MRLTSSLPPLPPPALGGDGGGSLLWIVGPVLAASVASVVHGGGSPAATSLDLLLLELGPRHPAAPSPRPALGALQGRLCRRTGSVHGGGSGVRGGGEQ